MRDTIKIELPYSIVQKMTSLRDRRPKIYYYLFRAASKFFNEYINIAEMGRDIKQIRFSLVRDENPSIMQIHLIGSKPYHLFTDADNILRTRMENFHKFDSDIDYFLTVLYFFCKHYDIPFQLVPDFIFDNRIKIITTDISRQKHEILKYFYIAVA